MTANERRDAGENFFCEHGYAPDTRCHCVPCNVKEARREGFEEGRRDVLHNNKHELYFEEEFSVGEHIIDCRMCEKARREAYLKAAEVADNYLQPAMDPSAGRACIDFAKAFYEANP